MSSGVNSRIFNLLKENYIKNRQDISPEDIPDLEVRALRGIGKKVWQKLKKQNIITIRDLAAAPIETLIEARISPRLAEKWSLAGKVILDSASTPSTHDITETKIIIAGVENAGKTSVLQSIREMKTMGAERPTKGMRTDVLSFAGYNLSTWDLGGQKTFRDQYFNNPDLFLRTSIFFYVVDIQDDERISDSFDYFSRLVQILKYLQEKPMLAILLHKFDPEIRGPIIEQKTWHIKEDFREIIQKIQFEEPLFFKTSIYDLISLTKSLSTTFSKMSPVSEIIVSTLGHFSTQRNQALSCLLFAENGLIISEFISGEMPKDTKDVIMFESMCLIREFNKDPTLEKINEFHEINGFMLRLYPIPVGRNTSVILAVISHIDEKDREKAVKRLTLEEGEESLQEQLTPWIQSFFRLF